MENSSPSANPRAGREAKSSRDVSTPISVPNGVAAGAAVKRIVEAAHGPGPKSGIGAPGEGQPRPILGGGGGVRGGWGPGWEWLGGRGWIGRVWSAPKMLVGSPAGPVELERIRFSLYGVCRCRPGSRVWEWC